MARRAEVSHAAPGYAFGDRAGLLTAVAEVLDGRRPFAHLARRCPPSLVERVRAALLDDLDVPTALAVAVEAGGDAARQVIRTLALQ